MVRLTVDLITKNGPGHNKRRPDESVQHYLNRLTHLNLQEKSIDKLESIPLCKNLTVLYLYDNYIEKIENLDFAPNLAHLYLQNNEIKRLENLNSVNKLTKLYIGGNSIKVLEGLENLTDLVELHIDNQDLPSGEKLLFDPRTLASLVSSLTILNISGNNLDTLTEIGSLVNLEDLNASNNKLNDMKELSILLKCWPKLIKLNLIGNPICSKNKYRERIIVQAPNIEILDEKEIKELSRQFLQNWKISKETCRNKNESNDYYSESYANELPRINNLNQMPTYVMPEHRKKQLISSGLVTKNRDYMNTKTATSFYASNYKPSLDMSSKYPVPQSKTKINHFFSSESNLIAKQQIIPTNGIHLTPIQRKAAHLQNDFVLSPKE
ncbi:unnamed protein product [Brachionus calyciflorus]|uniref:Protein phosphatase 1 regulatory subunit 42 n=1 Tax=Brachionus calyciflorus TaxID=104777 RepID=A0A813MW40_9BILA|nr:unnamed protein product [Brachionus calyciflorus]